MIHDDVPGTIRDATLVRLQRLAGKCPGAVVAALASTGTAPANADAIAARCIADLEHGGALGGVSTLVAYGATFGASVAMLAAARRLACIVVVDDTASREERNRIAAFGAEVRAVAVRGASDDPSTIGVAARRIASEDPAAVLVEKRGARHGPADEIAGTHLLEAVGETLFAVVGADRDAATLNGIRRAAETTGRDVAVVRLSSDGATWSGTARGTPLLITEREALATARRAAAEEGVLASAALGGAALAAALRIAGDAPDGAIVLALVPAADRGDLLTAYDERWWNEHHGGAGSSALTAAEILGHKEQGPDDLVTLAPDATVVEAIAIMRDLEVSQIPVVRDDRIVGTIREDQVIDLLLHAPERKDGPVEAVMEDPLPEIDDDASVDDLQSLLVRGGSAVIVRRSGGGREILTKYDLIHALTRG